MTSKQKQTWRQHALYLKETKENKFLSLDSSRIATFYSDEFILKL